MEVRLDKRYPLNVSLAQAWAVLSDIPATAACMPGAAITGQVDATHYKGTVKSKVGPATMSFAGEIEVLGLDAAARSLRMVAKGADRSGSSAAMDLTANLEPGAGADDCVLVGRAAITVSGKLAQFGSRLMMPVADVMLGQFAGNFLSAAAAVAPAAAAVVPAAASTTEPAQAAIPVAAAAQAPAAESPSAAEPAPAQAPRPAAPARQANEINALGFGWAVFKSWFAGLFGKRT